MTSEQTGKADQSDVAVEVWADFGCPWCFVAKHRLEEAIRRRPDAERFTIQIRSFELYPSAPKEPVTNEEAFLRTHAGTAESLLQGERGLQAIARGEGLEYAIDRLSANTFDLHRVTQYAGDRGLGYEFFSRTQDGLFSGALNPWNAAELAAIGESVGLDGQRVREILVDDEYADRVRADRADGLALGGTGVPFVVMNRQVGASGAQQVIAYAQMLEQAAGLVPDEDVS